MRAGILPFFLLACLVVFFWTRHIFGNPEAALATLLFTLVPPVLAHAGVATTDMGLAACLGLAFFLLVLWAESPTWKRSVFLGMAGAAAALTKFTALGFFPAGAVLALLVWLVVARPAGRATRATRQGTRARTSAGRGHLRPHHLGGVLLLFRTHARRRCEYARA